MPNARSCAVPPTPRPIMPRTDLPPAQPHEIGATEGRIGEPPPADTPEDSTSRPVGPDGPRLLLTESALDRIREMLSEEDLLEEGGLRITVKHGGGCAAPLQFGMIMEVEPEPDDLVLARDQVRLFLDPKTVWAVDGLEVDFVDTPFFGSGFAFRHPRGASGRAC